MVAFDARREDGICHQPSRGMSFTLASCLSIQEVRWHHTKQRIYAINAAAAMTTEIKLRFWRGGQTAAERLAGNVLHLDGFSSLDPQCPLGGPDGIKDVICEKNGWKYIGAAYFPTTKKTLASIRKKYLSDLDGVAANKADGLVFVTNQTLSPTERENLVQLATSKGH